MQVDATFSPNPPASQPVARSDVQPREQASSRPVERPAQDQATENRQHPAATEHQAVEAGKRPENERREARADDDRPPPVAQRGPADPARIGELLDVLA